MGPTVFRHKNYRFFFFSREEKRVHIHIGAPHGEAKFWLDPIVALAQNYGLNPRELSELQKVVQERSREIKTAWKKHFER